MKLQNPFFKTLNGWTEALVDKSKALCLFFKVGTLKFGLNWRSFQECDIILVY